MIVLCDFGDCQKASTVWVSCKFIHDGKEYWPDPGNPYCDEHKEHHALHIFQPVIKYESEKDGMFTDCNREKRFIPISTEQPQEKKQ